MNVLVVGGAGYIGSHTALALAEAGHTPVVFDNLEHGHEWAVQWGPLVNGDLADHDLLVNTMRDHRIEAVIHFAGYINVGESVLNPRKYFDNNVTKSLGLLNAMLDSDVGMIIFSSSCAIYGEPLYLPLDESHSQNPISPYGDTKLSVERMLRWYGAAYGLKWAALRYFNAAGADPESRIGERHDPETHLIPLAIEAALGRRAPIQIFGTDYPTPDGTNIRDYSHVLDLASAHVNAISYLERGGTSRGLNLGSGTGYSVREIIRSVERIGGTPVPYREGPRRAGDPPELVADATLARRLLDWTPVYTDLDEIVRTAWAWHAGEQVVPRSGASRVRNERDRP